MGLIDRSAVIRAALAGVFVATLALSACGRKGDPEPPPNAAVTKSDTGGDAATVAKDPSSGKPNGRFVLDPLLR